MIRNGILSLVCLFLIDSSAWGQNLLNEKIRKISGRKKSIFVDKGIFHNGGERHSKGVLVGIRQFYSETKGEERLVLDFKGKNPPKIYSYFEGKKLHIDVFNGMIQKGAAPFGNSKFIQAVNLFPIEQDLISFEVNMKQKTGIDMFYLSSPARIVVDIRPL